MSLVSTIKFFFEVKSFIQSGIPLIKLSHKYTLVGFSLILSELTKSK